MIFTMGIPIAGNRAIILKLGIYSFPLYFAAVTLMQMMDHTDNIHPKIYCVFPLEIN